MNNKLRITVYRDLFERRIDDNGNWLFKNSDGSDADNVCDVYLESSDFEKYYQENIKKEPGFSSTFEEFVANHYEDKEVLDSLKEWLDKNSINYTVDLTAYTY